MNSPVATKIRKLSICLVADVTAERLRAAVDVTVLFKTAAIEAFLKKLIKFGCRV